MKIRDFLKKAAAFAVSAACAFTVAGPVTALADYPQVDRTQDATLEITDYPVESVDGLFNAYEVARFTDDGKLELTDGFKDTGITDVDEILAHINDVSNEEWRTLASSFDNYEGLSDITPIKSTVNDAGNPYFDFGSEMGVYLITGLPKTVEIPADSNAKGKIVTDGSSSENYKTYTPQNFLAAVPNYTNGPDDSTGGYTYDVVAKMDGKYTEGGYKSYEVKKVWDNAADPNKPVKLTVRIVTVGEDEDGKEVETEFKTVDLSEKENNWSYKWTVEEGDYTKFRVYEDFDRTDYTWKSVWDINSTTSSSVSGDSAAGTVNVLTITNTYVSPTPTPTKTPTPTPRTVTSTPRPTTVTTRPTKTGDTSNIALWIVVIVAAGVVLGVAVAKKTKKNS